jgi:hypothetical protein
MTAVVDEEKMNGRSSEVMTHSEERAARLLRSARSGSAPAARIGARVWRHRSPRRPNDHETAVRSVEGE